MLKNSVSQEPLKKFIDIYNISTNKNIFLAKGNERHLTNILYFTNKSHFLAFFVRRAARGAVFALRHLLGWTPRITIEILSFERIA